MKERHKEIVNNIRSGDRLNISEIARKLNQPISTISSRIEQIEKKYKVDYTALLDFKELGFLGHGKIVVKLAGNNDEFAQFMKNHQSVNSIYCVNDDFDFLLEVVFKDLTDVKKFVTEMNNSFVVEKYKVFQIIDTLKKEGFVV